MEGSEARLPASTAKATAAPERTAAEGPASSCARSADSTCCRVAQSVGCRRVAASAAPSSDARAMPELCPASAWRTHGQGAASQGSHGASVNACVRIHST